MYATPAASPNPTLTMPEGAPPVLPTRDPVDVALGVTAAALAPAMFVANAVFHVPMLGRVDGMFSVLFTLGWACGAVGLRRQRATGTGRAAAVVFALQMTGLALQMVWNLLCVFQVGMKSPLFHVTDLFWPLSVLYMLVVGTFTVRAGGWKGWRRFTPLFCAAGLPLAVAAGALGFQQATMAAVGMAWFGAAWAALGCAVATHRKS